MPNDELPTNTQRETIEAARCDYFNTFLAMKTRSVAFKKNSQILSHTVLLSDAYCVDFNLVNGDDEAGPYLDVILFDEGQEVQVLPPERTKIEGTYKFYDSFEKRELTLILEREKQPMPRFFVTIKETKEIDTEFEVNAPNAEVAKEMCKNYEQHINRKDNVMGILGENHVTTHSREVISVNEAKES
jgi:hypothetical protein